VEDGEHVRRHHLPERTRRSPRSLCPTTIVCCPIATVCHPTLTVCCPSTAAIFCSAATKLYRLRKVIPPPPSPALQALAQSKNVISTDVLG
jgi:hypothetical protein